MANANYNFWFFYIIYTVFDEGDINYIAPFHIALRHIALNDIAPKILQSFGFHDLKRRRHFIIFSTDEGSTFSVCRNLYAFLKKFTQLIVNTDEGRTHAET